MAKKTTEGFQLFIALFIVPNKNNSIINEISLDTYELENTYISFFNFNREEVVSFKLNKGSAFKDDFKIRLIGEEEDTYARMPSPEDEGCTEVIVDHFQNSCWNRGTEYEVCTEWVLVNSYSYVSCDGQGGGSSFTVIEPECPEPGYVKNDNGVCVPQIINELTDKAACVYGKMVDNNNNINWILENFKDKNNTPSQFDLKFVMAIDLPNYINGQTSNIMNNTITIKINENTLSGRTNLEVARTILHEGIHARLKEFMYRNEGSTTANFPGIYDFFRFKNNWGHQQMASYYRSTIAKGLKQFDNGQHSDSYYNALAWVGLNKNLTDHNNQGTTYNTLAWDSLSTPEQTTILNTIQDEKDNGNKNCN